MDKELFKDKNPLLRRQMLEDNCAAVERITYTSPFSEEEMGERKTELANIDLDMAALEEEKKRQLEEAAKALEEKHGDSKFKPTIMTYNDVTKTATPYEPENRDDDDEPAADPQDRDDDMPSEEELAVYDTDYLNADDEDSSEEEHDAEDHSSDEEK